MFEGISTRSLGGMLDTSAPTGSAASQESPLMSGLVLLERRVTALMEEYQRLEVRLSPLILHVPEESESCKTLSPVPASDAVQGLRETITRVDGLIASIKALQGRLQV